MSIGPGDLTPEFGSNATEYSLVVPQDTTSIIFNGIIAQDSFEYPIYEDEEHTLELIKPDDTRLSKIEINIFSKISQFSDDVASIEKYTIGIAEEVPPVVVEPPIPITPDVPEDNYSYEDPNNCFSEKWGYYEMKTNGNLADKSGAYLEMYRRVYNVLNNGDSVTSYQYQKYGTTNIVNQDTIITLPPSSTGLPNSVKAMIVPFGDLGIDDSAAEYVWKCVCIDCPEIMWRFCSVNDTSEGASDICATADFGYGNCLLIPYYPDAQRLNYLSECKNTFDLICQKVEETYGITYVDDIFTNNNARYSAEEKRKIGKVIHDFLELNNVYGSTSEGDGMNQTMYPALSMGIRNPVCASYAQAFKYCCWRWGIHAICINGSCNNDRDARHQWNLVCYEVGNLYTFDNVASAWQEVDCTWDDPFGSEGANTNPGGCSWAYFNITTNDIERDQPTEELIDVVAEAGYTISASRSVRSRFATKYPFEPNTASAVNIEHYITYPARGTCRDNIYQVDGHRIFDNTNELSIPEFNGQIYYGF